MTLEEKTETVRHLWMARWIISLNRTKAYFKLVESVFYGHGPVDFDKSVWWASDGN
jgi:hypothetical protein